MKGYIVSNGNQYYAVIYEGRDPVTGSERRRLESLSAVQELGSNTGL